MNYYYTDAENRSVGPVPFAEIQRLKGVGSIHDQSWVIEEGATEWESVRSLLERSGSSGKARNAPIASATERPPSRIDLQSASMVVRGAGDSGVEVRDGQLKIRNPPHETIVAIGEVSGANLVLPGLLLPVRGYLHIATFSNPAPPSGRIAAAGHPQCVLVDLEHVVAVQGLFEALQVYLAANPARARHPEGEVAAEGAMKLDVLPQAAREVYDQQVADHDVRFVIMGAGGSAIVALTERLVVIMPGFLKGPVRGGRATSFRYADIDGIEIRTGWINNSIEIITRGLDPWKPLLLTKALLEHERQHVDSLRKLIDEAKAPAASPAQTLGRDIASQLQDLADLRSKGILSEEEFTQAKKKILDPLAES